MFTTYHSWLFDCDDLCFDSKLTNALKKVTPSPVASYAVKTDDATAVLTIDLPGVKRSDLSVTVDKTTLQIESTRDGKKSKRNYVINDDYDPKSLTATLEDGVLKVTLQRYRPRSSETFKVEVR